VVFSHDQFRRMILFLADEFETFARGPAQVKAALPRRGVRAGIIDGDFVCDRGVVRASDFFNRVQFLGRRHSQIINPHLLVEPNGIDD